MIEQYLPEVVNYFLEPNGLLWLAALLILILFYLIKARPKRLNLPTTRFLFKDGKVSNFSAMFSKFKLDPIFFLQVIALLAIILSIARPFVEVEKDLTTGHTVLVIDNSASMLINNGDGYSKVIDLALQNLGEQNSIITTSPFARVVSRNSDAVNAKAIIETIKPSHTGTNYKDAIKLATQMIEDKESSRILVIGDLVDSYFDLDYKLYKESLEAKQYNIDFIKLEDRGTNIGIIDLEFDEESTTIVMKNFNSKPAEITLQVDQTQYKVDIDRRSIETFTYKNLKGDHIVQILDNDNFMLDNKVFISGQKVDQVKVLLVSNQPSNFLKKALDVNKNIQLQMAEPPVIPNLREFNIVIFEDIEKQYLIDAKIKELRDAVDAGVSAILIPNEHTHEIDFGGLFKDTIGPPSENNELVRSSTPIDFLKGIEFGNIRNPNVLTLHNSSVLLASTDNTPVITMNKFGNGNIVFLGINSSNSDFKFSYQYPIFFKRMINFLSGKENLDNLNFQSGQRLPFKGIVTIDTALGSTELENPTFDSVGFYTINDKKIAVNLLDEKESNIVEKVKFDGSGSEQVSTKYTKVLPEEVYWYLLIFFACALILEAFLIKWRGDL